MTDPKVALAALGWRVDTTARYGQAVKDFQRGWNLGAALAVDGDPGPKTRAALEVSLTRRAAGLPDFSAHFSAVEFQCNCGDGGRTIATDCARIWTPRSTVQMAERYRSIVGPYTPVRACRCARENRRVGGASRSQHLSGRGLDVPVYKVTPEQVRAAGIGATGVGYYPYGSRRYVRHIDNRPGGWVIPWGYPGTPPTPLTPRPPAKG